MEEVVAVCAIDKGTKEIKTITSCDKSNANHYAKYYRVIGYNAKVMTYEELEEYENRLEKEKQRTFYNSYDYSN